MNLTRIWSAAALAAALTAGAQAQTLEVVTRCQWAHPEFPGARLTDVQLYHFGEYQLGTGNEPALRISDGRHRYILEEFELENLTTAVLRCDYASSTNPANRQVIVPIPGLLLRCESVDKRIGSNSNKRELIRFWCTSRIEASPR